MKKITPDQIKYNAKLQIQKYLESFFTGSNRKYLEIASPISVKYDITNTSVEGSNIKERKLQIARYFNELKNFLPAIVITDYSMKNIPQSIGLISNATGNIFDYNGVLSPFREIGINIVVGSNDIQTTDTLTSMMSLIFNEFRNLGGGSYMTGNFEKGENWVVTLPNMGIDFGAVQDTPLGNDPTDKIFYTETSFNIFYEDAISFNQVPEYNEVLKSPTYKKPEFDIPDQISFNNRLEIKIKNYPAYHKVVVSNYKIATVSHNGILTPRGLGKTLLNLVDERGKVVISKEIEIVY